MPRSTVKGWCHFIMVIVASALVLAVSSTFAIAAPLDNWHQRNSFITNDLYNVTWGGGRFVAVGRTGAVLTSTNGLDWSVASSATSSWLYGAAYGNGTFVAAGQAGTIVVSNDGLSWAARSSGTNAQLYCATFGGNRFVVVGDGGTIVTSTNNGNSWSVVSSGTNQGLFGVAYGNGLFVIVGDSGIILTSSDGVNWSRQTSNTSVWFDEVAFGNGLFVAAGQSGTIMTSSNGTNWIQRMSGTSDFYCVAYGSGNYVAVGANGQIFTSPDGGTWTQRGSGVGLYLRGVVFGGSTFVVTGFAGTVLQSDPISGAPVASAGPDQAVVVGTLVTLNGSNSYDPDGGPVTYAWQLTSKPAGSVATLANPTLFNPTFTADLRGRYTVSLVVTDTARLQSEPDQAVVTAGNLPVANAGQNQSIVKVGSPVALDGRGSSSPDGLPITYAWSIVSRPSGSAAPITNPTSPTPLFTPDTRGTYRISLTVTDSMGLQSQPGQVTVTAGAAPVANAGADTTVQAPTQVTVDGSGSSSPDGAVPLSYAWQFKSKPGGSSATLANPTTVRPTFSADAPGAFVVSLVVTDSNGLTSQPAETTVTASNALAGGPGGAGGDGGGGGGGCFIATAVYGSDMAPQVVVLKRFRDKFLLTNLPGRYIVQGYYAVSPPLATFISRHETIRMAMREFLRPVVFAALHPFLCAFGILALFTLFIRAHLRLRRQDKNLHEQDACLTE